FAEDIMIKGFFKVFNNLKDFGQRGSFEGWVRKIMIHEAIDFLRTTKKMEFTGTPEKDYTLRSQIQVKSFETDYLQRLIDELPEGYRVVFVMATIEGYKHHEIAEILGISEGTSKSQLFKARKMLQRNLQKMGVSNGYE